jgi:hypothetical protein
VAWLNERGTEPLVSSAAEILIALGQQLTAFLTYDSRLADNVRHAGIPVLAPA